MPQPNIIINADGRSRSHSRSRSRERARPRSRSRLRRYEDDDYYEEKFELKRGRLSRTPSPYYRHGRVEHTIDYETRKALDRLKILEQEKADEEAHEKYKTEMEIKKAKEQLKKAEAEKEAKELEKRAVEKWQREQDAKKAKEKKEKEEVDKKVEEELRARLMKAGNLSPRQIDDLIHNSKKDDHDDRRHINELRIAVSRPTYIKVHKKHLLPETLEVYGLPWTYDVSFFQPIPTSMTNPF
jgi:hypothetical protein